MIRTTDDPFDAMDEEFTISISKSKDGRIWGVASEGQWKPPNQPQMYGEMLPEIVFHKLMTLDLKNYPDGGTYNLYFGEYFYRFDLQKL